MMMSWIVGNAIVGQEIDIMVLKKALMNQFKCEDCGPMDEYITTSPVTIENLPDRDFTSEQVANKLPTTSVLFNVGIVEILSCNSL